MCVGGPAPAWHACQVLPTPAPKRALKRAHRTSHRQPLEHFWVCRWVPTNFLSLAEGLWAQGLDPWIALSPLHNALKVAGLRDNPPVPARTDSNSHSIARVHTGCKTA